MSTNSHVSRMSLRKSRISRMSTSDYGAALMWRAGGKGGFKVPKFQNSYRLEPYLRFPAIVADKILSNSMIKKLQGMVYQGNMADVARNLAADIRDQLYKTDYDRVKYVVTITIIEKLEQALVAKQGFLWDSTIDTLANFVFETDTFWAFGSIYVLYYE